MTGITRRQVAVAAAGLGLTALLPPRAFAAQAVTVGAYPSNPPWEFKDADGTFQGFEVDVVKEVAKRVGLDATIADSGFQALFAGTTSGRIDMAVSSITITNDRLKNQSFTQPYYDSDGGVLTKASSTVKSTADLKGLTLGAIAASSGEAYIKKNADAFGLADTKSYNTQEQLLLDTANGRIDGAVGEVAGFYYAIKKMPGLKVAIRVPTGERFAVMMKKGSPLLQPVNDAISAMKKDGTMAAIHKKWFGVDAPAGSSTLTPLPVPTSA